MKNITSDTPDERLMEMFQNGSYPAFEALFQRHSSKVLNYLAKKTTAQRAQDLTQEVFIKLLRTKNQYKTEYPFLPWLFTLTRNLFLDDHKKSETKLEKKSINDDVLQNFSHTEDSNESNFLNSELEKILATLPSPQKEVIHLRYLQDWSFEQIATHLSLNEENVRQILSRGLRKLKALALMKGDAK